MKKAKEMADESPPMHFEDTITKTDDAAPNGKRYVTFHNSELGRGCHALQGFAVDGRSISELELHPHQR